MKILYLIGNGFDLNLGMATSYRDFYQYYTSIKSESILVQKLKIDIDRNIENWSDLELALGKYTAKLTSTQEFNEVFDDIEDKLGDYLEEIESNFDFSNIDGKKLFKYFVFPENSLPQADKDIISLFKHKWRNTQWDINLITFNYTRSLEKLLDYSGSPINVKEYYRQIRNPIILHRIEHIHGFYNERMVMGVNDVTQITNNNFHDNQDVIETLVKSVCNQAQKHTLDNWCKSQITNANLICIFGSSIGDTDNLWWELIGEQLKRECRLIIFVKCESIPPRRPQKGKIAERRIKQYFLDKTKLTPQEREHAEDNIFIGINTNMFAIK